MNMHLAYTLKEANQNLLMKNLIRFFVFIWKVLMLLPNLQ